MLLERKPSMPMCFANNSAVIRVAGEETEEGRHKGKMCSCVLRALIGCRQGMAATLTRG